MDEGAGPDLARLERYLASVQGGLAAYPEAQVRGTHVHTLLEGQPRAPLLEVVPGPLRPLLLELPMASEWVPEAHFGALLYTLADVRGMSDGELLAFIRERNRALFSSPLYRMLLAVISPAALLRLASARWGVGHRGTSLTLVGLARREARLALRFPPRLYDAPLVRMYADSFALALERSRARDPRVTVESLDDTGASLRCRW